MKGPSPEDKESMKGFPQVGYLKNYISSENIIVGDYTYYDDPEGLDRFESNVLYHFPFIGDKLLIGKFFAIAKDVVVAIVVALTGLLLGGGTTATISLGWCSRGRAAGCKKD